MSKEDSGDGLPDVLYFGCNRDSAGHYFWQADKWTFSSSEAFTKLPWGYDIDGRLCPYSEGKKEVPRNRQIEGLARRHFKAGWTAIAFWDRSVDGRFGSNSVFLVRGGHSFERVCELAKFHFPRTWERFQFEIVEQVPIKKAL